VADINQLSAVDTLNAGDLLPIWKTNNGDTRKAAMSVLQAYMQENLNFSNVDFVPQYAYPAATGFTVTLVNNSESRWLIMSPLGAYATGTIILPSLANLVDNQEIIITSTQSVASLTLNGNGATIVGSPGSIGAGGSFRLKFNALSSTWYRLDEVITSPNFIDSIAALRLLTTSTNVTQTVLARNHVAGDGGGIYRYDASDTTSADNGATVIVDAASRRWKRQFTGVNVARTSVFQTFQAALTAVSAGGVVIIDKDETITTPVTATITGNVLVIADGYHLITFNVSGHLSDLITITPSNYQTFRISGPLIFDCGATGRHFFAMTSGTPEMADVTINNSYYDCFHFPLTSNYRWVENFRLERCRFNDVGRNVWSVTMTGTLAVFLNETIWYECELRGLARRAVGRVLHVTYTNANAVGAKVSGWKIIGGNYDAQQAGSLTSNSVDHFIYLEHTAGDPGIFSDLFIASGGIESTTGTVTGKKFIETSGTVTVGLVNSQCWIAYNWVFTPNDTILNQVGTTWLYNDTEAYAPRYKAKPNGIIFQGDGAGRITGVRNAGIGFQTQQTMTASTPFTIDIPITSTGDYSFFPDLIVEMTHTTFWATIGSRGIWRVSAMRDASTNQVDAELLSSITSGAAYGFDATTGVAWSRPNATTVRATVTPGADVGDGGRNVLMRCAVGKTAGIIGNIQLTSETL
jgi:hypothetical protein